MDEPSRKLTLPRGPSAAPAVAILRRVAIAYGRVLDLLEREVHPDEVGSAPQAVGAPVLAVVRADRTLPYDNPEAAALQAGDRDHLRVGAGQRLTA